MGGESVSWTLIGVAVGAVVGVASRPKRWLGIPSAKSISSLPSPLDAELSFGREKVARTLD